MNSSGMLFLSIAIYVVVTGLSLWALFAVIKAAIVAGLREHTLNSVIAVSVVSAVPLIVAETKSAQV